ncbi:MAG: HypC/HybG/HupF family hydrogenase formation chaperone [Acidobacteriota bacterium]
MCLAVPMRLVERNDLVGVVELEGVRREVSLMLQDDAALGEYLLVHAGYAIGKVDEEEAQITLDLLRQLATEGETAQW